MDLRHHPREANRNYSAVKNQINLSLHCIYFCIVCIRAFVVYVCALVMGNCENIIKVKMRSENCLNLIPLQVIDHQARRS